jgi:hypothetical protein
MAINRIAGQTLQSELLRDGENLAIQNTANSTPVLYIDIANSRVGINTNSPTTDFEITGNIQSNNISVTGNIIPTANVTYTLGNLTNQWSNVYADLFVGDVVGNISGNLTVPGSNTQVIFNDNNIAGASSGLTFDKTSNLLTVGGNVSSLNVIATGDISSNTANIVGNIQAGNIQVFGEANINSLTVTGNVSTDLNVTGNIAGNNISSVGLTSTANLIASNTSNLGNISVSNNTLTTINANGNIYLDPIGTGTVLIVGTGGFVIPVGNTAQRPGTPDTGTVRYNSETENVEIYDGTEWDKVTSDVTNQVIVPDGSSLVYTLDKATTAPSILVSINGLVQIPGVTYSYTVSGNVITFAEAPLTTDIIDIRFL